MNLKKLLLVLIFVPGALQTMEPEEIVGVKRKRVETEAEPEKVQKKAPFDDRPHVSLSVYKKLTGVEDYATPATILGLRQGSSKDEIRQAFKALAVKWHPDKNTDPEANDAFKLIIWAAQKEEEIAQTSAFEEVIPEEVKILIFSNLASAGTFEQAIKNIHSAARVNTAWQRLISDPKLTDYLIDQLAKNFKVPDYWAAIRLDTPGSLEWLKLKLPSNLKTPEAAIQLTDQFLAKFELLAIPHFDFDQKLVIILMLAWIFPEVSSRLINYRSPRTGNTFLYQISYLKGAHLIYVLLKKGADPNIKNNNGETALMVADLPSLEVLLAYGANPNLKDEHGNTALSKAIRLHSISPIQINKIKILLAKGADPNITLDTGLTPLMATIIGHGDDILELVRSLINHGAKLNLQDRGGRTALIHAIEHNRLGIAKLLLESGANPNLQTYYGETALSSNTKNTFEIAQLLLAHGVNPNIQNDSGKTLLMVVAPLIKNIDLVKLLLEKGANPNLQDKQGQTALMAAATFKKNVNTVKLLLAHGADPNIKDVNGHTALTIARQKNNTVAAKIIEDHMNSDEIEHWFDDLK